MNKFPTTLAEAKAYRYHRWGGDPHGTAYQAGLCAAEIWRNMGRWGENAQCSKKNGHGPGRLYCNVHALEATSASGEKLPEETWYWVSDYSEKPSPVQVIKSTTDRIWKKDSPGNSEKRIGSYTQYYPSLYEALEAMRNSALSVKTRAEAEVASAVKKLQSIDKQLSKLEKGS